MKTTKSLLLALVAVLLVGFSSCKNDPEDLIIGTWKYNNIEVEISPSDPTTDAFIKAAIKGMTAEMGLETGASITFNNDGTCTTSYMDEGKPQLESTKYSIQGDKLTIGEGDDVLTSTFQVKKKELRIIQDATDMLEEYGGMINLDKLVVTVILKK